MGQQMGNQPLVMLSEDSQRTSGEDAQSMNVAAGRAIGEAVRTTLGPMGMDKMLVSGNDVVITNDGATILEEMEIDHPAANVVADVAATQEQEAGDGTTTAVVVASELLDAAEALLDDGVHPTTVVGGYRRALGHALGRLEALATDLDPDDREQLERIAATAMTGKAVEGDRERLAELVVDAALAIVGEEGVDLDDVRTYVFKGDGTAGTELVEGIVVNKNPKEYDALGAFEEPTVGVFYGDLEVAEPEVDARVNVTDPGQLRQFQDAEEQQLREQAWAIAGVDVDVCFVSGDVDDRIVEHLAGDGVLLVEGGGDIDVDAIARATGAEVVSDLAQLVPDVLGSASRIARRDFNGDKRLVVESEEARFATVVMRGGTAHVIHELERTIEDALGVVGTALDGDAVVPGGGAAELEVAQSVREHASSVEGRQQLAVEAFADAVDVLPRTLAENAGLDPIDALVELRARHADGETAAGLDVTTGEVVDMDAGGVVEPLGVKTRALESATEAAVTILRIDDVIAAGDLVGGDGDDGDDAGPGGPGGMGGMGGMGGAM